VTTLATETGLADDSAVFNPLVEIAGLVAMGVYNGGRRLIGLLAHEVRVEAVEPNPERTAANYIAVAGETTNRFVGRGAEKLSCTTEAADDVLGRSLQHVGIEQPFRVELFRGRRIA